MALRSWLLGAALLAAGCSMPSYVKTAYYGDLPALKSEIHAATASGHMGRSNVMALAEAVARRELRSARGDDALPRILSSSGCVKDVEPELRERARGSDDVGAAAMLLLADAGAVNRGSLVDEYARSPSGAWRAVAARGTAPSSFAELRRAFYVDGDERVRREALRSGLEAHDPADLSLLLEAARLDPDPLNRSIATRASGAIGGADTVQALVDLWPEADADERLAIVDAWSMPKTFAAGGADELLRIVESGGSISAVVAASDLSRLDGEGAREGRAALARAMTEGTADERRVAIELASLGDPEALAAIGKAATSDDPSVRVSALGRLTEIPKRRAAAITELESLARAEDSAARQARLALVAAGDSAAVPLLQRDLATDGPTSRARAAAALFRLGHPSEMAEALADADPSVRMNVACSVLSASDSSG